jgi:UDPglucose 6-dehydrogenase
VTGCDPKAAADALEGMDDLAVTSDPYAAAAGAHCLVVCTEWPEYAALDLARLRDLMALPIIVDGRNVLDPAAAAEAGFTYLPTGRPARGVGR